MRLQQRPQQRRRGVTGACLWALAWLVVAWSVGGADGAHAKSWCASPLWVHEWGVHVFEADGSPASSPVPLPAFFYGAASGGEGVGGAPVRHLPADSGVRALPALHFYGVGRLPAPLGLEVGITDGRALVWYPQVDTLRTASEANSPWAQAQREALVAARAARVAHDPKTLTPLGPDPTRQLVWEALTLSKDAARTPRADAAIGWLPTLRALPGALWVSSASGEAERFVFYEGQTEAKPLLRVTRGDSWRRDRAHYVLQNPSAFPVHDVWVVARDTAGGGARVFYAPSIPAGAHAGFLLEGAPLAGDALTAQTRTLLLSALTDAQQPQAPEVEDWSVSGCVMGRDPALPVEAANGHRLFRAEAEAILDIWGPHLFDQHGVVIVYREDTRYLDAVAPLSLYTDMFHHIDLRRAGLVVWRGLDLEKLSAEATP